MHQFRRLFATALVILVTGQFATGLEPDEVFTRVSPCVVKFSNIEGSGSGVVLSKEGLIITNYHVVNAPLPLEVTAKVKLSTGKVETKTFKNIEVYKVHPEYDLALVKVEADGALFAPAKLISKTSEIRTGQTCFAIGNPSGGCRIQQQCRSHWDCYFQAGGNGGDWIRDTCSES